MNSVHMQPALCPYAGCRQAASIATFGSTVSRRVWCHWTLRMNRMKNAPLKTLRTFWRLRGSHYFLQDEASGFVTVQWLDSRIVPLASNWHSAEPLGQTRRWSHEEKNTVTISQPHNRMSSMNSLLSQLLSEQAVSILSSSFGASASVLFAHCIGQKSRRPATFVYPPELKNFALSLHFYSSKAYDFVCSQFITPYRDNRHLTPMQARLNIVHSAHRSDAERAFAWLRSKVRRLKGLKCIHVSNSSQNIVTLVPRDVSSTVASSTSTSTSTCPTSTSTSTIPTNGISITP